MKNLAAKMQLMYLAARLGLDPLEGGTGRGERGRGRGKGGGEEGAVGKGGASPRRSG